MEHWGFNVEVIRTLRPLNFLNETFSLRTCIDDRAQCKDDKDKRQIDFFQIEKILILIQFDILYY